MLAIVRKIMEGDGKIKADKGDGVLENVVK